MVFTDKIIGKMSENSMTLLFFLLVYWLHHFFIPVDFIKFEPVWIKIGKANTSAKTKILNLGLVAIASPCCRSVWWRP